jgi:hypothetical protein
MLVSGVALLLIASFALASQPARASMDRPTWAAGNFWVYVVPYGSGAGVVNGTLRMDVTGTESVTLNGTAYPCYKVSADFKIPLGLVTFEVTPDIWFSVDTLAIVKISVVIPPIGNLTTTSTTVIAGSPPQTIQWPLTAGATWSNSTTVWTSSTNATRTTWASVPLLTTFQVQSDATITVPAGTFSTTPIKEISANGSYTMNFWSAQVGNWARVGSYDASGRNTQNFNLTSYSYSGGGGFFGSVVLGLPVWIWLILLIVILVAIVGFFAVRRRKPPAMMIPPAMPPPMPPQEPPMGP